ncbi:HTH-type transcriptional regulator TreR [Aeromonas bestiarum]|uniref:HTH-type transcriptional regulator TreR n=1 Tax=Aeromonas bestiarum TaxID=105751 RepID=A0AAW7I1P8_9GAMM|nr:trehalose operon repressor TreR [Aeromonas bestiarum]MDM5140885.1 trehalose operon repressor TreR [Aeromonas bestiarum]WDL82186.1 HTH-type transcriptional regulator TreR [Aeromonas bestiarum]
MDKKLTILDIARLSGVGKSTVSRVLNQDPKVKQATRERVEQVIAEHGFVPSKSARAMRSQSQQVVGIIVSRLDSSSENQAVRGMLETLYRRGYDAVLMESKFSPAKVQEHLAVLDRRGVDGIILFAFNDLDYDAMVPLKEKLVLVARDHPGFSSVCFDDAGAVRTMLAELATRGIRDIAYLGVDTSDLTTGQRRLDAYLGYCAEQGLTARSALGDLSLQSGYRLAAELLTPATQALVCASDTLAIGAAKYLQEQGRSEVLVTGLGNNPMLSFLFPNALSLDLGYKGAGEQAARQLLGQIEQDHRPLATIAPCHTL